MADTIDKAKTGGKLIIRSAEEAGIEIREGKRFVGWSTEPNGGGLHFRPGQKITMFMKYTLYPVFVDDDSGDAE